MLLTLLLSAMLYGRGRKVLTLWGGRARSSSDSGLRPEDTSLSSCPALVLLALDKKRELQERQQTERKENTGRIEFVSTTLLEKKKNIFEKELKCECKMTKVRKIKFFKCFTAYPSS